MMNDFRFILIVISLAFFCGICLSYGFISISQTSMYDIYPSKVINESDISMVFKPDKLTFTFYDNNYTYFYSECCGSMKPVMGNGNIVILRPTTENEKYNKGDIVVIEDGDKIYMHYIFETEPCILTKGMNNKNIDGFCIPKEQIKHKAVGVFWT